MEVEITNLLDISDEQKHLIDMHSLLNILNIVVAELTMFTLKMQEPPQAIEKSLNDLLDFSHQLYLPEILYKNLENMQGIRDNIFNGIDSAIIEYPELESQEDTRVLVDNLTTIFSIAEVRAQELLVRRKDEDSWIPHNIERLIDNFNKVFFAIEKNSKGRYRIVNNIACHQDKDYLVDFNISSVDGDIIVIPAVLQDVMRDLLANARKYTEPGGRIVSGLHDNGNELIFIVEDNGRGIPEDQISKVVNFGFRANNILDKQTKGGGFGLTKAYLVTKRYDGRMWIHSEVNKGTQIKLVIPRPKQ